MSIISGTLSVGQTVKTGDYENKKAEVVYNFTVPEGAATTTWVTDYIASIGELAKAQLGLMLSSSTAPQYKEALKEHKEVKAEAPTPDRVSKSPVVVETAGPEDSKAKRANEVKKVVDEDPLGITIGSTSDNTGESNNNWVNDLSVEGEDEFSQLAPEITDADLTTAMTKTNVRIKNPGAIRKIVGMFVAFPKQAREIPQDKRQSFIDALANLS